MTNEKTLAMKIFKNNIGSETVEFIMAFMLTFMCFLIVAEFICLAIGSELVSYAAYMGSRSIKVNPGADIVHVVRGVVPWVPASAISLSDDGSGVKAVEINSRATPILGAGASTGKGAFSTLTDSLGLKVTSSMIAAPQERKAYEDNPLWNIAGN